MIKTTRSTWSIAFNTALATMALTSTAAWSQALPAAGQQPAGVPARDGATVQISPMATSALASAATAVSVDVAGFKFVGNRSVPGVLLESQLTEFVGKKLDLAGLDKAADRISRFYRAKGYTVARAYLPPQHSADGVIQIAVIEGQYSAINLKNASSISNDRLQKTMAANICDGAMVDNCKGQNIQDKGLERAVLLIKDLPGVTATANLKPGAAVGTSDLDMTVTNTKTRAYNIGIDNYGAKSTGEVRLNASADLNNLAGDGDQLSLGLATTTAKGSNTGSIAYSAPFGYNGTRLGVAAARSQYRLGAGFESILSHGTSNALSAFISHPVLRSVNSSLYLRGVVESRKMTDSIDLTGVRYKKSAQAFRGGFNGDNVDSLGGGGYTVYGATLTSGNITTDDANDALQAKTAGRFSKISYNLARQQALSGPVTLYGSLSGQQASKNLDPSEQIGIGGPGGVRAYASEAGGSTGAIGSVELRYTTPLALSTPTNLTYALFVDRGWVKIYQNQFAGSPALNTRSLGGYGLSATMQNKEYYLRAMWAAHAASEKSTVNPDSNSRFWLQGGLSF